MRSAFEGILRKKQKPASQRLKLRKLKKLEMRNWRRALRVKSSERGQGKNTLVVACVHGPR